MPQWRSNNGVRVREICEMYLACLGCDLADSRTRTNTLVFTMYEEVGLGLTGQRLEGICCACLVGERQRTRRKASSSRPSLLEDNGGGRASGGGIDKEMAVKQWQAQT
ncbi:LOW QUALITY PROTEIN: hypothetical protein ColTof4_05999 [Colletotrichum tofieldiae]|nr:LOW QUALITY PROTEIN: hypothetical protein ColTof3_01175 [Colletotrichum tofieldiae]GKT73576.1 LOW QUALITY PROTEIN: hypothetical protein ColTof4_05999 [Colletotrichum tofieldiae]GKT95521.1 LOW QUALITY PROTEIN: hypothetical protein Ct61P_13371 [Colletotrichum tofieldiae]